MHKYLNLQIGTPSGISYETPKDGSFTSSLWHRNPSDFVEEPMDFWDLVYRDAHTRSRRARRGGTLFGEV